MNCICGHSIYDHNSVVELPSGKLLSQYGECMDEEGVCTCAQFRQDPNWEPVDPPDSADKFDKEEEDDLYYRNRGFCGNYRLELKCALA